MLFAYDPADITKLVGADYSKIASVGNILSVDPKAVDGIISITGKSDSVRQEINDKITFLLAIKYIAAMKDQL